MYNEQISHFLSILTDIVDTKYPHDPKYKQLRENLNRLGVEDKNMIKLIKDIPKYLKGLDVKKGKNKGLDQLFYKMIHGYFKLQNGVLVKQYNRGKCEPELKPIIEVMSDKIYTLLEVMNTSLDEECNIQRPDDNNLITDLQQLVYHPFEVLESVDGAHPHQHETQNNQLRTWFTNLRFDEAFEGGQIPLMNIEQIYNAFNFIETSGMFTFSFSSVTGKLNTMFNRSDEAFTKMV